jgi:hypothetical protein
MDSTQSREPRVLWSLWVACALAATGAIAPLLLAAGGPSRISGGAIPFGIAAIAMAANALTYPRGRSVATALYVVAWLAIVYGILRMLAVPLQVAVVGSCQLSDSGCSSTFARPFSGGEGAGIAVGVVTGALALQVGFFGLRNLYRGQRLPAAAPATPTTSPLPVSATPESAPSPPEPTVAAPVASHPPAPDPGPTPKPAGKPKTKGPPKPMAELPPPSEPAELPPPSEPPELPPHSEPAELPPYSPPTEPASGTPSSP